MKPEDQIINKKELKFWKSKIKILSPKEGDILIVPAEGNFNFATLSEALKHTPIKYALVTPHANAALMSKDEALRFAKEVLQEHNEQVN